MNALFIMIGGGAGAVFRYGTTLFCVRIFGPVFPVGTLLVNLIGCFLIGIAMGLADRGTWMTPGVRLFFVTGFLGGFTTFSSYAWETLQAVRVASLGTAVVNMFINNIAGLGLAAAGFWSTRG